MINDEILEIKDNIINAVPIEKLYLFGSYAYGTPNDDSDYDFYIVIPNNSIRPLEAMQKARQSMRGMERRKSVDILAGTTEVFERRSKRLTLEKEVLEKGVLLYEKSWRFGMV